MWLIGLSPGQKGSLKVPVFMCTLRISCGLVCKRSSILWGSERIVNWAEGRMLRTAGLSLQGDTLTGELRGGWGKIRRGQTRTSRQAGCWRALLKQQLVRLGVLPAVPPLTSPHSSPPPLPPQILLPFPPAGQIPPQMYAETHTCGHLSGVGQLSPWLLHNRVSVWGKPLRYASLFSSTRLDKCPLTSEAAITNTVWQKVFTPF